LQTLFTAAKVALSLTFLIYASWSDHKTREVSNRVWVVYAPLALFLSIAELLLYEPSRLPFFGLSFGITAVLALLLFYSGAFGGADAKALMCIALALPFSVESLFTPLVSGGVSPLSQTLFPLTIFSNAVLFAAATGIYMLFYQIVWHKKTGKKTFEGSLARESVGKKLIAMITGHKVSVSKLKEKWHVYPMEDAEEDGENPPKRKLVVVPRDEGRDEIVARLSKAADSGRIDSYVWATPGLPMLVFITVGLIVSLVFGDVVWLLVSFALR
jgi:preflagellin peptidase FlaK